MLMDIDEKQKMKERERERASRFVFDSIFKSDQFKFNMRRTVQTE
jgi:hypothetical protein